MNVSESFNLTLPTAATHEPLCDFKNVKLAFASYYHYLSLIICIFGSVTNILNICVLTSKQLRSPTNLILTGLAFTNLLLMVEYIPFVFLFNENRDLAKHFTYNLAVFVIFNAFFTQTLHFISCCLTVILAIWQYIAIKFPQNNNKWCSDARTKITILATYLFCATVCLPLNLSLEIKVTEVPIDARGKIVKKNNVSKAIIYLTRYRTKDLQNVSSYVYAIAIKLIPSVLLTVLSTLLIIELLKAKERRKNLMNPKTPETTKMRKPSQRFLEKEKQTDRTTRMLLVVLLLFLMVELPQAIFGLLNVVVERFETDCYQPLGDIVDVLTLTNFSINFILYCIMSKKFRTVFKEAVFPYIPCANISKENWISLNTIQSYV